MDNFIFKYIYPNNIASFDSLIIYYIVIIKLLTNCFNSNYYYFIWHKIKYIKLSSVYLFFYIILKMNLPQKAVPLGHLNFNIVLSRKENCV